MNPFKADNSQNYNTIFDDVFRTMLAKTPRFFIWLINEVFHDDIPDDAEVVLLQNEFLEIVNQKVITDSHAKIGRKYYHVECQSNPDGTMAVRMIEYDFLVALQHAEQNGYKYTMKYPESCVLYLRHTSKTPDYLKVQVEFPNNQTVVYQTPIIKISNYELKDIFEKKLFLFLPYYMIRYEKELPEINNNLEKLSTFLKQYHQIFDELVTLRAAFVLTGYEITELSELIRKIADWIAKAEEQIKKGVSNMGGKVLEFEHDILIKEYEIRGEARGEALSIIKMIDALTQNLGKSVADCCTAAGIKLSDYIAAKQLLADNNISKSHQ